MEPHGFVDAWILGSRSLGAARNAWVANRVVATSTTEELPWPGIDAVRTPVLRQRLAIICEIASL